MIQSVSTATATTSTQDPKAAKLKSAAQAFEAVFLRQMIGSMRQAGLGDGMLDSDASNQFRDMADSKLADSMSQKGVLGIADMLIKQMTPIVEHSAGDATTGAKA
ncbi:rod-binding protein [Sphingomonas sp. PR090111-T3T-6A]|uniref:rod-binding protein n=1 Tax=Sphingomonas sp. PR090111-T3T-6A TaxID=685778 RepID=UPI000373AA73|nr:rod-binding protein [Sphingomonas sp. PR090111-T3T-6A]